MRLGDKLDTSEPGVYTITYVVKNSVGGTAAAEATITVEKETTSPTTTSTSKPIGKTSSKPTGKLPSTGEKSSGIIATVFGFILLSFVIFKKKRINS